MEILELKEAFKLLESSDAVIINDDVLVYPSLSYLTGEDDNEFLYLSWNTEKGLTYALYFIEENNKHVKLDGSVLYLYDTDSTDLNDVTKLTLLAEINRI